jgi:hypothetical protein
MGFPIATNPSCQDEAAFFTRRTTCTLRLQMSTLLSVILPFLRLILVLALFSLAAAPGSGSRSTRLCHHSLAFQRNYRELGLLQWFP